MGGLFGTAVLALAVRSAVAAPAPIDPPTAEMPASSTATLGDLTLSVRGEPPCVSATALLDRIAAELPAESGTPVTIEISGDERELAYVITTSSGTSTRRFAFDDVDCDKRSRVLALAIVLAVEALVVIDVEPLPPEPAPQPEPEPTPAPAPPPRKDVAPPPPAPTWSLAIAPIAVFGAFPIAAFGGELQPRISGRYWSVRLGLAAFASPPVQLGVGTFRAVAFTAAPDACGRIAPLRACGGIEAGVVWGRGRGYAQPRDTTTPVVAPRIALELAAPLSPRVDLVLGTALAVPILRTRFVAGDLRASGWPVTLRAMAGIAVDLARGEKR